MKLKYIVTIFLFTSLFTVSCNAENYEHDSKREIQKTIQNYFDGRRNADIELLKTAFSKDARLMTTGAKNELIIISLADYFSVVQKQGKITVETSIDIIRYDDQLGYAQVLFNYGEKSYTDFLLLIKSDIGWRIVNKSFKLNRE